MHVSLDIMLSLSVHSPLQSFMEMPIRLVLFRNLTGMITKGRSVACFLPCEFHKTVCKTRAAFLVLHGMLKVFDGIFLFFLDLFG